MSYFSTLYSMVRYPIATEQNKGLRNAQIGAIHAIAAHATIDPLDTAVIVMPTGSGKTTVLMLAPYILLKTKVLIVTPSTMVRGQIADEFTRLKTLKNIGVFDLTIEAPHVYEMEHLYSVDQDSNIAVADVVIASHQVAASLSDSAVKSQFDYVIIDEAHHVPAPTWQKILTNMKHASSLLVTATPFRLDKKEIHGTHIYNYPLSKAYKDGIFGAITFIPIEEAPEKDRLIALEAERVLQNDRADNLDHYLMVRTDTKEKAKTLEILYGEITKLHLKRIDSSMSYRTIKHTIEDLKSHKLDGVICVDMLGEGFDFPNLKIAAIHEPQKSLASTLQFVGRFARTNADRIGTAKFIAMNDEALRIENHRLYTSDAVWQDMIIELSEQKIQSDLENSAALKEFTRPENGQEVISLHNIRPNCHARVYRVDGFNVNCSFPDDLCVNENIYRSFETNTVVGIASKNEVPLWLEGDQAVNTEVNLYIVHYQSSTGLLFIYSQIKTENTYESIALHFCHTHKKVARDEMNRVLAGYTSYEFFNTGMQNRYAESGESYRIYAGSNTAASIDETTGRMLSAGHAFCKVNQAGEDSTIGYSSGSKFWSSTYLSIPEYIKWCDKFGEKINDKLITVKTNTNFDRLPVPTRISEYSDEILFAFFSEKVYLSPPNISLDGQSETIGLLTDADLHVVKPVTASDHVDFVVSFGEYKEQFSCDKEGQYRSATNLFVCRDGTKTTRLFEYFNENPLIFKTASDSIYTGHEVLRGNETYEAYDINRIDSFDWTVHNTDITVEEGIVPNGKQSIQATLKDSLLKNAYYSHIVFDHGTGEVADFITFASDATHVNIELYHCKAMKGAGYNSSVDDVYEVAQQAIKSTIWLKSKSALLDKLQKRIKGSQKQKFIRGDLKSLKDLLRSQRIMVVTIYIVQPAISKSISMEEKIGTVLSAATFFIRNTGRAAALKVIGSP